MHEGRVFGLCAYFDTGSFDEVAKGFRSCRFTKATAIKIYPNLDATIGPRA